MDTDKAIDIYQKLDTLRLSMWLDLTAYGEKCLANPTSTVMETAHDLLSRNYYLLEGICAEFSDSLPLPEHGCESIQELLDAMNIPVINQ